MAIHQDFDSLLDLMKDIHDDKNSDYAGDVDPLANFTIAEEFGVPAWLGCLVRLSDKFSRIKVLARKEFIDKLPPAVEGEKIEDTLLDLANYALLTILLRRKYVTATNTLGVAATGGAGCYGPRGVDARGKDDAPRDAGSRSYYRPLNLSIHE